MPPSPSEVPGNRIFQGGKGVFEQELLEERGGSGWRRAKLVRKFGAITPPWQLALKNKLKLLSLLALFRFERLAVVLKSGCTLESSGMFLKSQCPDQSPNQLYGSPWAYDLGISSSYSAPGDSNEQPRLRTTNACIALPAGL